MSLGLHVGKQTFIDAIDKLDRKMSELQNVIDKYRTAKTNLDQFVEAEDSSYEKWVQTIDERITAAGKARAALNEQKDMLQKTVDQMEDFGGEIVRTVETGAEAVKSTAEAALRVAPLL